MLNKLLAGAALALALGAASQAEAGPAADALTKCVVGATTSQDRVVLMKWAYVVVSANPTLRPMSAVTDQIRDDANHHMADLLTRLVANDCRAQAVAAVKAEGPGAVQGSVKALGESAARDLFSDPTTLSGMTNFVQFLDRNKLMGLMKDAGITGQ